MSDHDDRDQAAPLEPWEGDVGGELSEERFSAHEVEDDVG